MTLCIQVIIPCNDLRTSTPRRSAELKSADRKGGFPHSEITGSKGARASPVLIAACHVLHRLSTPRHPSEALMRLIVLSKTHACGNELPTHALVSVYVRLTCLVELTLQSRYE